MPSLFYVDSMDRAQVLVLTSQALNWQSHLHSPNTAGLKIIFSSSIITFYPWHMYTCIQHCITVALFSERPTNDCYFPQNSVVQCPMSKNQWQWSINVSFCLFSLSFCTVTNLGCFNKFNYHFQICFCTQRYFCKHLANVSGEGRKWIALNPEGSAIQFHMNNRKCFLLRLWQQELNLCESVGFQRSLHF